MARILRILYTIHRSFVKPHNPTLEDLKGCYVLSKAFKV